MMNFWKPVKYDESKKTHLKEKIIKVIKEINKFRDDQKL